jgi:hypothetical protein
LIRCYSMGIRSRVWGGMKIQVDRTELRFRLLVLIFAMSCHAITRIPDLLIFS